MQALRNASALARLVLAWFALSIGVAMASPIVNPQSLQLICSSAGALTLVVEGGESDTGAPGPMLDCPMCATAGAPPPVACCAATQQEPLAYATQPIPSARTAALAAAPLPARGPPTSLSI